MARRRAERTALAGNIRRAAGGSDEDSSGSSAAPRGPRQGAFTGRLLLVLVLVGAYTLLKPRMGRETALRFGGRRHTGAAVFIGALVGFYDGILGPGTGSFFLISLVAVLGHGFLEATVRSKIANLATNLTSIVVFGLHGELLWVVGLSMAAGNLVGGLVGARTAVRLGSGFVRRVFLLVLVVLVVKLAVDTWRQFA